MSNPDTAVFLSYASQDAAAAKRICDALRAAGIEVWFDQNALVGGDAWDQTIRRQIRECALLVPVISRNTQARGEGYFRLEWRLADQRTHLMGRNRAFLLPVVIDDTPEADADVPDSFTAVQWTRAPEGEVPQGFVAQVGRVLSGVAARETDGARAAGDVPVPKRSGRVQRQRLWLVPVILGTAVAVIRQPWRKREPDAAVPPPGNEALKLVAQARKIFDEGDALDRENLLLADDLAKRAIALDAAEPSAWLLGAQVSYTMVWHSFDASEARMADLQRQAARARALAPDSIPAQLAVANARVAVAYTNFQSASNRQEMTDVESDLLALVGRAPRDYAVQLALGQVYRFLKQPEAALVALRRALDLSGGDPEVAADVINVLLRRKRYAEAEAMIAPAMARRPIGRIRVLDLLIRLQWRGDLPGAQAALATWPSWLLREDRGAFIAWQTWLWSGQPARALEVAERLPREYLQDVWFSGPRAVLTARAHELAGHPAAAAADWHSVVRLADRELASQPEDAAALFWKSWALSRLGDRKGAESVATLLQQRMTSQTVFFNLTNLALLWSTLGRIELAADHLRAGFGADNDAYAVTRAMLELDPAYAPLRKSPRFAALAAAAIAPVKP